MPAPTVVGTSLALRYTDPSLTVPAGANYVFGGGSYVTGGADPGAAATLGEDAMTITQQPASYTGLDLVSILFGLVTPDIEAGQAFAPTGTGRVNRAVCSFQDVDTGAPVGDSDTAQGASASPAITITSDAANTAVAVVSFGVSAGVTISAGTGETVVVQYEEDGRASAILAKAGAGSVSFAPTLSASTDWSISALSLQGTAAGPTIDTQPVAGLVILNEAEFATKTFTSAATGETSQNWQEEDSVGAGTYTDITNGGIYSGATTDSLVLTPTSTAKTGFRYRNRYANGSGTTYTNAVALTVYTGAVITTQPGVTNGSGVFSGGVVTPATVALSTFAGQNGGETGGWFQRVVNTVDGTQVAVTSFQSVP